MTITRLYLVPAVVILGLAAPVAASAGAAPAERVLVVSPHGSDNAAGTASAPLKTIQTAVNRLSSSGGVVELEQGVYHQRIKLIGVDSVTVEPYRGQHAILSGAGLTPRGESGMVTVRRSNHITVRGLDITAYRTNRQGVVPIGIYVHGHDRDVRILNNHVHDMGNDNNTLGSFNINAHGIAVYGDDPHASVSNLQIEHNTVDNLHLGASETVVVNGNVNHWTISHNQIHDNDNIGIDAIGFEPTLSGKYRYTQTNRARNGVIAGNTVARIRSRGNPAYWDDGWCNCADGIYVDGGTRIKIYNNRVTDSDIGIEVAAENPHGNASHVDTTHNHVTGSLYVGITTGGYCNGAKGCGGVRTGASYDNTFKYNTLRGNNRLDDGSPELLVQYYAHNDTFEHNTITATNDDHVVYGTVPNADDGKGNLSNDNTFRAIGASARRAQFGWRGHVYNSFAAYRKASGQDANSTFK